MIMEFPPLAPSLEALYARVPRRVSGEGLICACEDCIAPEVLDRIAGTDFEALSPRDVGAWFRAAAAIWDPEDGPLNGPSPVTEPQREEGLFFLAKLLQALAAEITDPQASRSTLRPDAWFVTPGFWVERLLLCGLPGALPEETRLVLDRALLALVGAAIRCRSARLMDGLDYLGAFGQSLPRVLEALVAAPLRVQAGFWAKALGGKLDTPAARQGQGFEDLRRVTQIMPRAMAERMNAAFLNPRLGDWLLRAALRLPDGPLQARLERAYGVWENSAAVMAAPPRGFQRLRG